MNNSKPAEDVVEGVQPHPLVAAVLALALVGVTILTIYEPIQSPLTKNWIVTLVLGSSLLISVFCPGSCFSQLTLSGAACVSTPPELNR